ncbi:DUF2155 domain-containing protein [Tropicimonas marinistellae]|uniref:DUF2155 domain-containing protein n=1 Tax=Tropicimonas marinistellae TaxID=1739787 RepID=UPI00083712EE|nr:DUF2155 domain-containing protein [Tropicimonas marinistellae]
MRWLVLLLLAVAPAAMAQQATSSANGGVLRLLDKISGDTVDIRIGRGQTQLYGRLKITMGECRYPAQNPNSDAFGWLEIRDDSMEGPAFSGWMIASSPALNGLDHPRYDVWLLRCNNE